MTEAKSVIIIVVLIVIIGAVFALAYRNIKDDEMVYEILPDAGPDKTGDNSVYVGDEVIFRGTNNAEDEGYPRVLYEWDFDNDGEIDSEDSETGIAKHTYDSPNEYHARFIITVIDGTRKQSKDDTVVVTVLDRSQKNTPPVPKITVSSNRVNVSETIQFLATSSYDTEDSLAELTFSWDFESDGIEDSAEKEVFYSYSLPGDFEAWLYVTDTDGVERSTMEMIYVTESLKPDRIEVELEDDGAGDIDPNDPFSDSSFILNWDMTGDYTEGLKKIEVILLWDDLTWDLDIIFGRGENTADGEVFGDDTGGNEGSGEGNITLETDESGALEYDDAEQWFVEITTKEAIKPGGDKLPTDSCTFTVSVILWYVE